MTTLITGGDKPLGGWPNLDCEEDERDDSPYCDCGAIHDDEEVDYGRCNCCGKRIADTDTGAA